MIAMIKKSNQIKIKKAQPSNTGELGQNKIQ